MPIQAQTTLPDADAPTLGNGVEDEIAVSNPDVINYGTYRIQCRETGQSAWDSSATGFAEQTIDADADLDGTEDDIITGREDGEEYEVRVRTETEHATGAWTDPVAITAKFPGAISLDVTVVSPTEVSLEWIDQADNETGQEVVREQRVGGEWWPEEIVDDAGPNTESYTDDSVQPNTEYRYRVRPYTEHTSADSNLETVTTDDIDGVRDRRVPASGYYVEVEHPSGETLRPTILADDNVWQPQLNGLPQVRLPVPRSDTWEDHDVEGATIRVWKDGYRLPIETLRDVERSESQDVLVARGGEQLLNDVAAEDGQAIEYVEADAHVAAESMIENDLGWLADVDDPATDTRDDVELFRYTGNDDFQNYIQDAPFAETDPRTIVLNEVYAEQTAWFIEGEDAGGDGSIFLADQEGNDGAWSGNRCRRLSAGQTVEIEFRPEYVIPEGEAEVDLVWALPTDPTPAMDIRIDVGGGGGTYTLNSFSEGTLIGSTDEFELRRWPVDLNPSAPDVGDLPDSTHTIEVEIVSGGDVYLDFCHIRDNRYDYATSDITPVDAVVTGWEEFPEIDLVFEPVGSVEQVVAGSVEATMTSPEGPAALGLRNDTADAFDEATGTTTHSAEFADGTQLLQSRVTLGRYDTGSESVDIGAAGHVLDVLELRADLVNVPVLLDFVHAGTYLDALNRMADVGDSIWELRRAPESASAPYEIVWTQSGQRVGREPALVSYEGRRTIEGSFERVIVEGKSTRVEGETFFTADDYGLFVGLQESPIVEGSETVYDVGDRDTQYERGLDYSLDHYQGTLTILDGGAMTPETEYEIDYEWRYQGRFTDPAAGENPRTTREHLPEASSDRECEQLALAIVRQVAAPLEEATVTISDPAPDRSLVAAIDPTELPFDGPLRVRSSDSQPQQVQLTVGSRRKPGEIVDDLRDRLTSLARNV
ncbi:fibronectin type III domain-containing protein [Halobellus rufus]|uniref:fibronectin type III domain-containing protein n=1 Tax=Halobellus rufus TaxID=1448860 RepID=UPI000678F178|nr:fibronectin type III domain-containing protein [Halobellus rufus]